MGKVCFVGAGPGDPELITLKGRRRLRQAECVIYDRLVSAELLDWTRPGCEKIYVGKEPDEGGRGQSRIHRLLVEKAQRYRCVVRLKGGDPTVFGRLSEEMEALVDHGIPFEIVPGVSSVWSAAAEAGIPLTDRKLSSSVVVTTGHTAAKKARPVRWERIAEATDTLVILMARAALPKIVARLRKVRPASEPIALVRWASTPQRQVLFSTLGEVANELKRRPEFGPPVVAIVGPVARLPIRWGIAPLGTRGGPSSASSADLHPLRGRRIVLTRPAQDQPELARRLSKMGAVCVSLPTITIRARNLSAAQRQRLLEELPRYDWVLFNSRHGVEALARLARRAGRSLASLLCDAKICAIGPRTQRAANEAGLRVDLVPEEFSTEGVRRAFEQIPLSGRRVLIPRSDRALGDALAVWLRRKGAQVDEVALYETALRPVPARQLKQALRRADAVTFTSASTALGFVQAVKRAGQSLSSALNGVAVVAIGPATARALRSAGVKRVTIPKEEWTVDGLVEALLQRCLASARNRQGVGA